VSEMIVFRCSRKLLRHMGSAVPAADDPPKSTTRLGDWYANVLVVHRQHLVLAVSGTTLLPVLVPAAPYKTMFARFAEGAGQVLRALKIEESRVVAEENAMRDYVVTTTNDRRVLGSMTDFANMLDAYLDDRSLTEVAHHLAEAPCGPIGMGGVLASGSR
jgi:uncharacterized protein DUF6933